MSAGRYSGDVTGDPTGVPCDPEQWSEESKRSVAYEFRPPKPYRDKAYICCRCNAPDVFAAAEQKHAFEVRKAPIDQARVLCRACHRERFVFDKTVGECRHLWTTERATLRNDAGFLRRWLAALEALPAYNGPEDRANITMLHRVIAEVQRPEPEGRANAG